MSFATTSSPSTQKPHTIKEVPAPYKNVFYRAAVQKWGALIRVPMADTCRSRKLHLGLYPTAKHAAVVIDLALLLLGRPVLNFPSTKYSAHPLLQKLGDVRK